MKKVRTRKTLIYKQAMLTHPGLELQALLTSALGIRQKPAERRENLGADGEHVVRRVIGSYREQDGMLFGHMMLYEVGKDVTFVVEDEDADEFEVVQSNIGADDDKRKEILESVLYFGILANHVVILQSRALKARDMEYHLDWLMREATQTLPPDTSIILSDEPSKEAREKVEGLTVQSVRVGTPLRVEQSQEPAGAKTDSIARFFPIGKGFDVLSALLGADFLQGLNLNETLDENNLELTLQVRCKRKTTNAGHQVLDQIASAMRHMEPEDTLIHTVNGPTLRGANLKLTGRISVGTYNGVVDKSDLYKEMHGWLEDRIREGSVL